MAMDARGVSQFLDELLEISSVQDESANGLQVWAPGPVKGIALAVDACMETFRKAEKEGCQMVVVHHGLIWGGLGAVRGSAYERLKFLLDKGMALYAAHLPLDIHPDLGNNVHLARLVGLTSSQPFGSYHGISIGLRGVLLEKRPLDSVVALLREKLGTEPLVLPFGKGMISTVAVVSGGGSSTLPEAVEEGIDCFITGEARHDIYHEIPEGGINAIFTGHYAAETLGVKSLRDPLEEQLGVEARFIDVPTAF